MSIVLTKAALALNNSQSNFQVVKYEAHKKKVRSAAPNERKPQFNARPDAIPKKDLGLKKIRHEIVKFGMSGFDSTKKEEAKIALAVSLGAKPPKKAYINYKDLMAKRKEEKKKERDEKQLMISKSVLHKVGKSKSKNKGTGNDVGHFLSGYGKVQKKDLKNDESTTKRKRKK